MYYKYTYTIKNNVDDHCLKQKSRQTRHVTLRKKKYPVYTPSEKKILVTELKEIMPIPYPPPSRLKCVPPFNLFCDRFLFSHYSLSCIFNKVHVVLEAN